MSPETAAKINDAKKAGRRIIAVGTTAVRTLEAAGESGLLQSGNNWTNIFILSRLQISLCRCFDNQFSFAAEHITYAGFNSASRDIMLQSYEIAVKEKYRFFSFGDAMFIR